ncbi:MAG: ATP-binding protein [Acidobacteriota bacterium]
MSAEPVRCEFDQATLAPRVDITVAGDVKAIAAAVEEIMAVVREMSCAAGKEFEIELALGEALANAVIHGCARDAGKTVQVCAACDPERGLLIVIRDPGAGFDPAQVPSPVVGERLYREGGRGIYLINQLMDEVRYERGGTEIWMRTK